MSEQEEKPTPTPNITSDVKEKDPKRVAAGKKLGAKSKQFKEAKKQKQLQQEETSQSSYNLGPVLCVIGGLVIGGTVAYHVLFKKKDEKLENEEISETKPKSKRYLEDD